MPTNDPRAERSTGRGNDQATDSVARAFARYAEHLATRHDPSLWDQPAVLWSISVEALVDDPTESGFAFAFNVAHEMVLDGHPADALIGVVAPPDVVAVALCTEGWVHHPDRLTDDDLDPPSAYPDSIEVRLVHLLVRDGTEVFVQRARSDGSVRTFTGPQSGRVVDAMRRVMQLPTTPFDGPSVATVRRRVALCLVAAVATAVGLDDPTKVDDALDLLETSRDQLYMSTALSFGLFADTWDDAVESARRQRLRSTRAQTPDVSDVFCTWADGALWASAVAPLFDTRTRVIFQIKQLELDGVFTPTQALRIVGIADRAPVDDIDPF